MNYEKTNVAGAFNAVVVIQCIVQVPSIQRVSARARLMLRKGASSLLL